MTHEERLALARELTARLLDRHGDGLVAVGLHGPAARGDERDGTDLELAVVTAGTEVEVPDRSLRHRGVVVDLGAITADAYLHEATQVGPTWPLAADQYRHQLALHDPGGYFHQLGHAHEAAMKDAPEAAFLDAAGFDLVQLLSWEAKARGAELHSDLPGTMLALKEAALLAALVVGLATRTAYRSAAHALTATAFAEDAPPGFAEPYRRLLSPGTDPAGAVISLGRSTDALVAWAGRLGIPFEAEDLDAFL
jgi:kanamycin nucleotidyltransferase